MDTDRQRQDALARAEKLRALGEMASGIVHDVNNKLGLIVGNAEGALRALGGVDDVPAEAREQLSAILRAALDAAESLQRLQSFSKPRVEGTAARFELSELVKEVVKMTAPKWRNLPEAQGRPITIVQETTGDTTVVGWPMALREAFTNLIFNAVDAMPGGGQIDIRVERRHDLVIAEIADSGTGMSPEVRERAFEPFFSTKGDRGTGLGLVGVRAAVEQHDGGVDLESTLGIGTRFRLTLPAAPPQVVRSSGIVKALSGLIGPPNPRRILVIDDDAQMCKLVIHMLRPSGHVVTACTSAEDGLKLLEREPFDVVVSDLGLGAGMNGWELAAHVRQRYPGLRVILATGWGGGIDETKARAFGVDGIVPKPYSTDTLLAAVEPKPAA